MKLRICISDKFSGEADTTQVWDTHFEKYFFCPLTEIASLYHLVSLKSPVTHTHTHTDIYIYEMLTIFYFLCQKNLILKELFTFVLCSS